MARKKAPENETPEQQNERHIKETISNFSNRSEKTSWNRKMDNMVELLSKLRPIEDKILEIIKEEKMPILDAVAELRNTMVSECVHPFEYLVVKDTYVECKFCEKNINIPDDV